MAPGSWERWGVVRKPDNAAAITDHWTTFDYVDPDSRRDTAYDYAGRRSTVVDSKLTTTDKTTTYVYDESRLAGHRYPNGVITIFRHDAAEELREIAFYRKDSTGLTLGNVTANYWTAPSMASFGYTRDLAGQRRRSLDRLPRPGLADSGMKRQYQHGYDLAGRLTTEWVAPDTTGGTGFSLGSDLDLPPAPTDRVTLGYLMNLVGNRTGRTRTSQNQDPLAGVPAAVSSHGYDAQDRMTTFGTDSPTWDAWGNVISLRSGTTYSWDRRNRLAGVETTTTATLGYDHEGFRVSKTTGSRRYLVDTLNPTGFGQVLAEYTGDGTGRQPVRTYTYGRDLISRRTISGGVVEFYSADALGTTRFKTRFDQGTRATLDGALGELTTQTFNYDAFGQLVGGNPADTEYAFTGEEWDNQVGAYYLRARWYRPDWGRFLSRDTYEGDVEEPISQNRFLYGSANPVLFVDPSGHMSGSLSETIDVTAIQKTLSTGKNTSHAKAMNKVRRVLCRVGGSQAVHHLVPLAMGGMGTRGKNAEDLLMGYASSMNKLSHQGLHSIMNMLLKDSVGLPMNTCKQDWRREFKVDKETRRSAYQAVYNSVRYMDIMCKATKG